MEENKKICEHEAGVIVKNMILEVGIGQFRTAIRAVKSSYLNQVEKDAIFEYNRPKLQELIDYVQGILNTLKEDE